MTSSLGKKSGFSLKNYILLTLCHSRVKNRDFEKAVIFSMTSSLGEKVGIFRNMHTITWTVRDGDFPEHAHHA